MLQIGVCSDEHITYPFGAVMDREVGRTAADPLSSLIVPLQIDLRYLFRYKSTWPAAIRLASSGKLGDLEKNMISHVFSLEDSMKAFETVLDSEVNSIKVIVGQLDYFMVTY